MRDRRIGVLLAVALCLGPSGCAGPVTAGTPRSAAPSASTGRNPCSTPVVGEPRANLVGLDLERATETERAAGRTIRVLGRDGECEGGGDDLDPERTNLYLEDGLVVDAWSF